MNSISFRPGQEGIVIVDYINGSMLGSIYKGDDGYFMFHASTKAAWSEFIMQAICDKLKDLNKAWDAEVSAYLITQTTGVSEDDLDD